MTIASITGRIVGGTLFLGMSSLFGAIGVFACLRGYKLKTNGTVARGVVVGCHQRRRSDGVTDYRAEVEFQTAKGESIVFTASSGSSAPPALGRKVNVLYYPNNPRDADIGSPGNLWFAPFVLLVFATAFLAAAILFFTGSLENQQ